MATVSVPAQVAGSWQVGATARSAQAVSSWQQVMGWPSGPSSVWPSQSLSCWSHSVSWTSWPSSAATAQLQTTSAAPSGRSQVSVKAPSGAPAHRPALGQWARARRSASVVSWGSSESTRQSWSASSTDDSSASMTPSPSLSSGWARSPPTSARSSAPSPSVSARAGSVPSSCSTRLESPSPSLSPSPGSHWDWMHSPPEHSLSTRHGVTCVLRPSAGQPATATASDRTARTEAGRGQEPQAQETGRADGTCREAPRATIIAAFFMARVCP